MSKRVYIKTAALDGLPWMPESGARHEQLDSGIDAVFVTPTEELAQWLEHQAELWCGPTVTDDQAARGEACEAAAKQVRDALKQGSVRHGE